MTIIACPRCHDSVRIPARASNHAVLRCPLCSEEYSMAEAYGQIPELEIISGALSASKDLADDGEINAYQSPEPEYAVAGETGGVFGTTGPMTADAPMPVSGVKGKIRKKKEKSAIGQMIGVVGGGVIGIAGAFLVMWWVLKMDPMELGPKMPSWALFIVPEQFHPKKGANDTTANGAGGQLAQNNNDTSGDPSGNASGGGGLVPTVPNTPSGGSFMPADTSGDGFGSSTEDPLAPPAELPSLEPSSNDPLEGLGDPTDPTAMALPSLDPSAELPSLDPSAELPSTEMPSTELPSLDPSGEVPSTPNPAPLPGLDPMPAEPMPEAPGGNEPVILTAADLTASVAAAATAREAFETADPADRAGRQELARQMYAAVAGTAKVLPSLSLEDADNYEAVTALSELLTSVGTRIPSSVLGFLGKERYDAAEGDKQMLVSGTVTDIRAVGSMFECVVQMPTRDMLSVVLLSSKNPQDKCTVGDTVMVVGSKVDDPAKNVGGYEGSAAKVVTWDYGVKIAK